MIKNILFIINYKREKKKEEDKKEEEILQII